MTKTKVKGNVFNLALLGIFIGLIIALTFSGLGYIPLGPFFTITIVPIIVAVGATVLSPSGATILGFAFGISSFVVGLTGGDVMGPILFEMSPFGYFMLTIPTRVLVGLLTGLIFKSLQKIDKTKVISYFVTCLCCPLLNTILYLSTMWLFYGNSPDIVGTYTNFFAFFFAIFLANGIGEVVATTIIGTPIAKALAVTKGKLAIK